MKSHTIHVPTRYLAALKTFINPDEFRPALVGVLVEVTSSGIYMIATDGHKLGVSRQSTTPDPAAHASFIIPFFMLQYIRTNEYKMYQENWVEVTYSPIPKCVGRSYPSHGYSLNITYADRNYASVSVDARPVNWRSVFPATTSGEIAQFNAHQIAALAETLDALSPDIPIELRIAHNGNTFASLLDFGDENFIGVLMPLCAKFQLDMRTTPPDWILQYPTNNPTQKHGSTEKIS